MMLGLVQLLVGFVVAWEAVELVLRHGLLLSVFKLAILAALAAAAGCVAIMYVRSLLPPLSTKPHRMKSFVILRFTSIRYVLNSRNGMG
jgi:hypothetical protein